MNDNLNLGFLIETSEDREKFITQLVEAESEKGKKFSSSELELMGNYILYGKDSLDGKSCVDRKEIQIKTKYSSYKKKEPESLEGLMENPAFNEGLIINKNKNFKKVKPKIDRETDADIPGIKELWEVIDYYQHIVDVNRGKIEDFSVKKLTSVELYKMKHSLIDIRRQQFFLKDIFKPPITMFSSTSRSVYSGIDEEIPWGVEGSPYEIAPLGVITPSNRERFNNPRSIEEKDYIYNPNSKFTLDFRNSDHIYLLLENYQTLRVTYYNSPTSLIGSILDTLDFYIERTYLTEEKKFILAMKQNKIGNDKIKELLEKRYKVTHTSNYISTIWKQRICENIAESAILHYDYYLLRERPFEWKVCNMCGKEKLKDIREFVRKTRSSDGLSNRCKICDKINRQK